MKLIESSLEKIGVERKIPMDVTRVSLYRENIRFCIGCRACFEKGEEFCPLKDATLTVRDQIVQADGMVLASPVYMEDVNGVMKNRIDRMAFVSHRPAFCGKSAALVTTSGSWASFRSLGTMKNALTAWGFSVIQTKNYRMGAKMQKDQLERRFAAQAEKTMALLIDSIQNGTAEKPSFFRFLRSDSRKITIVSVPMPAKRTGAFGKNTGGCKETPTIIWHAVYPLSDCWL